MPLSGLEIRSARISLAGCRHSRCPRRPSRRQRSRGTCDPIPASLGRYKPDPCSWHQLPQRPAVRPIRPP
ncbi:hypothetical protein FOY91_20075 [Sphingomonas solaris]|uniref:Uncharacterized protein n=1 Tax=Alterirhizorhabdus solaris TaxID=2529389 RepID=A0A558QSD5_9SPHN|nr:hypothetical protein FOY91_20075 [Sphingomonas solaris]